MNIVFRVDASIQIGSGHVMRCLALAIALRDEGAKVEFVCREHSGHLCDYIEKNQEFRTIRLPVDNNFKQIASNAHHLSWLGTAWQMDAEQTRAIVQKADGKVDWLVVDHYALNAEWEKCLRPLTKKIMVIDDLADRLHECDLLLDQNFCENLETRYDNLVPRNCQKLLGPKYALLRPEFKTVRETLRQRDGVIRRVLIYFGNVDATNQTVKALQAIQLLNRPDISVQVVAGNVNPHYPEIKQLCDTVANAVLHLHVDNLAALMADSDLFLGAAGATTWERCCVGLPSMAISIAKNQEGIALAMAEAGQLLYLGKYNAVTAESICQSIKALLLNPAWVKFISKANASLVDGRGILRAKEFILEDRLELRPALEADCERIYLWRNAQENRLYAFHPLPISYADHEAWFKSALTNPQRIMLIGEVGKLEIGVLRYDMTDDEAKVSVYLVPGKHGQRYGARLLRAGSLWLSKHKPEIKHVIAEILAGNEASAGAFLNAGFSRHVNIFKRELRNG